MKTLQSEKVHGTKAEEWRIGIGSWDEVKNGGSGKQRVMKYAWRDKKGRTARGGEVPLVAVAQGIEFAIATGCLDVVEVLEAIARGQRRWQQSVP